MNSRGSKDESTNRWGQLGFVHDTKPLAVLIECGFIDTLEDLKLLGNEEGRFKIARGLARGICAHLGVTWSDDVPEDPNVACSIALKKALVDVVKQKDRGDDYKKQRDAVEKAFDKFKKEEYKRAVDLANTLEEQKNDEVTAHFETKEKIVKPLTEQIQNFNDVIIPKFEKDAKITQALLKTANEKIERLLKKDYTVAEVFHFFIRAIMPEDKRGGVISGNPKQPNPDSKSE